MKLEPLGSPEGRGARGHRETRASLESLVPRERKERPATRGTRDPMALQERGAALEREDRGGPQVCGGLGETRAKLDPKVTRDEKAPLVSLETRVRLVLSDPKDTEVTRAPLGLRVSEEPQDPLGHLETPG